MKHRNRRKEAWKREEMKDRQGETETEDKTQGNRIDKGEEES
jgi:hypothetical protein